MGTTQAAALSQKRTLATRPDVIDAIGQYLAALYEFDREQPAPERIKQLLAQLDSGTNGRPPVPQRKNVSAG